MKLQTLFVSSALLLCFANEALSGTYILATGRRDPRMYAIDLKKALLPENNNTPNAIVSRSKVALDRLDGKLLGDSANIAISEDGKTAFVVNHHGSVDNDEFVQHGGRGNIAVMNVEKMIQRSHDNTANALEMHIDSGHFGAVGVALLPDMLIIGNAESHLTEDGGNQITFVDRRTGSLRGVVQLALGDPAGISCPAYPVPFTSPGGPPTFPDRPFVHSNGALSPVPLLSPHESWGCFPDSNGVAIAKARSGKRYLYTANGGTDDLSVIDLDAALAGKAAAGSATAEIGRIPTQIGPWGIVTSPDGRHVVAANRESQRFPREGNTISIVDVENPLVEAARVRVGTDEDATPTRPFIPSFTPDGKEVIIPNFRSNNVSIVNLQRALANPAKGEVARIPLERPLDPDGVARPPRPKGSAVTADGRYAVISGGPRITTFTPSGTVWIIDLKKRQVVATVTGVGNDPYGLAVVEVEDGD